MGARSAAAARLAQRAYRARRTPRSNANRLTVRATVAPELVADLTDLLRRVTGRAASDHAGAITISIPPGVHPSDVDRELRAVVHRWSEMHPGVWVRVLADDEPRRRRRPTFRRRIDTQEPAEVASAGTPAGHR